MKHRLLLALALITLTAHAQDSGGWRTIFATEEELKDFPKAQAELVDGLLHVRAGYGIFVPQPSPDGAIRARFHFRERTSWPQLRLRRSADANPKDYSYYEIILDIKTGETSVNDVFVNFTSKGKIRRIAVVPLPKPFVLGDYVDLELSALGDHLQLRVNGKVAFETQDSSLATGAFWGVASQQAWFSSIQVRTYPPGAVSAVTVAKSDDLRIVQLQEAYAAAIEREVPLPAHLEAIQALDTKYAAALDRALEVATKAGNLDAALGLRTEKKLVLDHSLPPADAPTPAEPLNTLRLTYRNALSQLTTQREQRLQPLRDKYLQSLEAYQDELTRAKNLDAALAVKKFREAEAASVKTP